MGGYIIVRVTTGLTDALSLLWYFVGYAQPYKRTIILCLDLYKASKLNDIIDFSDFPVPVLCGESHIKNIKFSTIEPSCFGNDPYKMCDSTVKTGDYYIPSIGNMIPKFDTTKTYPDDVLLIFQGLGNFGESLETIKHIKFTDRFLQKFYLQQSIFLQPMLPRSVHKNKRVLTSFPSIHLRSTDYPGYNEADDIQSVDQFVAKHPNKMIYLACDNSSLIEKLCAKHPNLVKPLSYRKITRPYFALHYAFGKFDPNCLDNAFIDILMCASGSDFLQSRGGFSALIANIRNTPGLVKRLTEK
jgi:hypothetical protein